MRDMIRKIRKGFFKVFMLSAANRRYVAAPAVFESIVSADPAKLFVLTVAFNDAELIALQDASLKKFLKDPYEYFVADNSNREDRADAIRRYCLERKINYVRLPAGNPGLDGSLSHGFALNWVYANIVRKFTPRLFGFMDPDLYPVRDLDIVGYIGNADAWGFMTDWKPLRRFWDKRFACWIGLAFYRFDWIERQRPNFLPAWGLDTGGRIRVKIENPGRPADPNIYEYATLEVAPGVFIRQKKAFVHFSSASWNPHALEAQKQWMKNILQK